MITEKYLRIFEALERRHQRNLRRIRLMKLAMDATIWSFVVGYVVLILICIWKAK